MSATMKTGRSAGEGSVIWMHPAAELVKDIGKSG